METQNTIPHHRIHQEDQSGHCLATPAAAATWSAIAPWVSAAWYAIPARAWDTPEYDAATLMYRTVRDEYMRLMAPFKVCSLR